MTRVFRRKPFYTFYVLGVGFFIISHVLVIFRGLSSVSLVSYVGILMNNVFFPRGRHFRDTTRSRTIPLLTQLHSYLPFLDDSVNETTPRNLSKQSETVEAHFVAIVIPVHGALHYLASCLNSWTVHTTNSYVFLADDCETKEDSKQLEKLATLYDNITIIATIGNGSVG